MFSLIPLADTVRYSFYEYYRSGIKEVGPNFVGFQNYAALLQSDMLKYAANTLILWVIGFIPQIGVALLLAVWFTDARMKLNGLAPTTIERYRAMLPRINDAIGHLKLTQIRPQHLNDFYKTLSENGVRNLGAIAVAKKVLKKKVEALGQPKHIIAKESGIAHTTLNAILNGDAVKLETAEGIAKALGYTVSELFTVNNIFELILRGDRNGLHDRAYRHRPGTWRHH